MRDDILRDEFVSRLKSPAAEPLEGTRRFLRTYCYDAVSLDDIRISVAAMADVNPRTLLSGLAAINALLLEPPPSDSAYMKLVSEDANRRLEDIATAKDWLVQLATILREELSKRNSLK